MGRVGGGGAPRKLELKSVICSVCQASYQAKRQAKDSRCLKCRKIYLQDWRKKPAVIARKAELHRKLREKAFAGYGGKCACCDEDTFEFLAIDHVKGGGRNERKCLSTQQIARKVIREGFPADYRVLCHNCNQAIGWYGFCPHQRRRQEHGYEERRKARANS